MFGQAHGLDQALHGAFILQGAQPGQVIPAHAGAGRGEEQPFGVLAGELLIQFNKLQCPALGGFTVSPGNGGQFNGLQHGCAVAFQQQPEICDGAQGRSTEGLCECGGA